MSSRGGPRILLVEDNPLLGDLTAEVLREAGAAFVRLAISEESAHEAMDDQAFDLMVLDVWIKGRTGDDLAARAAQEELPVLVLSGGDPPESLSGRTFLRKPVAPDTWRRVINDMKDVT